MKDLSRMTVRDFLCEVSSDSPAPGGGSVAAISGALSAALTVMVTRLTIGKEKHRENWDEMGKVQREAKDLRENFLSLAEQDTEAFNSFFQAMKMPKETEAQKSERLEMMQEGLKEAAMVPLETLKACELLVELARTTADRGNPNAITDAGTAALMARSAAGAAAYNVKINLVGIHDAAFVSDTEEEVDATLERIENVASRVEKTVLRFLESGH
jgi:glutamate formiminotransferase/formiminotetrahydrofolate cyclodeaminase